MASKDKAQREAERRERQRQRRKSSTSNAGRFMIFDADGSEVLVITDKPIGRGDEPLCVRGCNCKPCCVRRYASALVEKGHPATQFIVDPKADGFWIRSRRRTWAFMSFRGNVGRAKPEIAEAAAALTEPLKLMDLTGSDKRMYAAAVRRARNAQRNMRIASEAPQFFSADLMMDVSPPCDPTACPVAICGCYGIDGEDLTATVSNTGGCSELDAATVTLAHLMPGGQTWQGTLSSVSCFGTRTFTLSCNDTTWTLQIDTGACLASASVEASSVSCDPFSLTFSFSYSYIAMSACECCASSGGTFDVTVSL